jgi:glycosyltransferase involved in cell wall biosynthesis
MKVLIITQYFYPENFRVNDLAAWLAERGHEVTVLTGIPNYPSGRYFSGYGLFRRRTEIWNGVSVVRAPLVPRGSGGSIRLVLNYLSFAIMASLLGLLRLGRRYDVIFVHEPSPITVGIPAIVMRRRTGARLFFWVLDLWPESVAAAGGVRSRWVLGPLERFVRWIYARCDRVLVQSRAFFPSIRAKGVPEEKISYFPNWAEDIFRPVPVDEPPVALPSGFRIIYAGNIGVAQDFPTILAAAEILKDKTDVHWILIGDGREASWVREQVARRGLGDTVHLPGGFPIEQMPAFFANADAMLVSLKSNPVFTLTVPAKVQAYMACGRPILAMLEGEGARVVTEAGAGFACAAGDATGLADMAMRMRGMSSADRASMGARGREYYLSNFDRVKLFRQVEAWMDGACSDSADDHARKR